MKKVIILIFLINFNFFAKEITPSDVYIKVKFTIDEVMLITKEMGKDKVKKYNLNVKDVSPREVFFQALTLFNRVNYLAFEYLRVNSQKIEIPKDIKPKDVYKVVDKALKLLQMIKNYLNIQEESKEIILSDKKTPTDVFQEILYANRLISILIENSALNDKVFSQINLAINYTTLILSHFKADRESRELYEPKYERYKTHYDIYKLLIKSLKIIKNIYKELNLEMLNLDISSIDYKDIIVSDIYNITSLVVSELAYIHSSLNIKKEPYDVIYHPHIFPSHIYQRGKLLIDKLNNIESILSEK